MFQNCRAMIKNKTWLLTLMWVLGLSYMNECAAQWLYTTHPIVAGANRIEIEDNKLYSVIFVNTNRTNKSVDTLLVLDLEGNVLEWRPILTNSSDATVVVADDQLIILGDVRDNFGDNSQNYILTLDRQTLEEEHVEYLPPASSYRLGPGKQVYSQQHKRLYQITNFDTTDVSNPGRGRLMMLTYEDGRLINTSHYDNPDRESVMEMMAILETEDQIIVVANHKSIELSYDVGGGQVTLYPWRSVLYFYNFDGELTGVKNIEMEYQTQPRKYAFVTRGMHALEEGGYLLTGFVGSSDGAQPLSFIRMEENFGISWEQHYEQGIAANRDTLTPNLRCSSISNDGFVYLGGFLSDEVVRGEKLKVLYKYDYQKKEILWESNVDSDYGSISGIEFGDDNSIYIQGGWDERGNTIPPLFGLPVDALMIANVDSLGRLDPVTSVEEPEHQRDLFLSLYPNPAWSETTVQIHGAEIVRTRMLDINGRQVLETEGHGELDVRTLAGGVYFVEVETNRGVFVRKLVVR